MKYPVKDQFTSMDVYLEAVITTCLTIHKEYINDNLIKITSGEMTSDEQQLIFLGKQLFSDEPQYKLIRLIRDYKEAITFNKPDILLKIFIHIDKGNKYLKGINDKKHDEEVRVYAGVMIDAGKGDLEIATELCRLGWYEADNMDSLVRNIKRWRKAGLIGNSRQEDPSEGELESYKIRKKEITDQKK